MPLTVWIPYSQPMWQCHDSLHNIHSSAFVYKALILYSLTLQSDPVIAYSRCLFVYLCVWYSGNFTVLIYSHNSYTFYSLFTQPNHFAWISNSFQCCHTWQFVVHVYLQWCKDLTFLSDLIGTILFSLIQLLFVISWQRQH